MPVSIQSSIPNSYSSQPLSSSLIQSLGDKAKQNVVPSQQDPSLVTPEDVNRALKSAEVTLSEQQQAQSDAKRSALVGLNGAQHQQRMIDTYLHVASDGDYSSSPSRSTHAALNIIEQAEQGAQISRAIEWLQSRDKDEPVAVQPLPENGASIQPVPAALAHYNAIQASAELNLGLIGVNISA